MKKLKYHLLIIFLIIIYPYISYGLGLQWDHNADADYYVVYYRVNLTDTFLELTQTEGIQVSLDNLEQLKPGVTYEFSVKAFNSCGNSSDFSDTVFATIKSDISIVLDINLNELKIDINNTENIEGLSLKNSSILGSGIDILDKNIRSINLCNLGLIKGINYSFSIEVLYSNGEVIESDKIDFIIENMNSVNDLKID